MGSVSAIFKAFLEKAFDKWIEQAWKDKFACGYTNSASHSGDKLSTLIQLAVFAAQMSMIWVGVGDGPGNNWSGGSEVDNNRLGSWLGAMGQSNADQGPELAPSAGDLLTAERLGKRLAEVTAKWHGRQGYLTERAKLA
jgi:NAD(P)H dehydrogenase (quinone)